MLNEERDLGTFGDQRNFLCGLLYEGKREIDLIFAKHSYQLPKLGPEGAYLAGEWTEHFHNPMEGLAAAFPWQALAASRGSVPSCQETLWVRNIFPESDCGGDSVGKVAWHNKHDNLSLNLWNPRKAKRSCTRLEPQCSYCEIGCETGEFPEAGRSANLVV